MMCCGLRRSWWSQMCDSGGVEPLLAGVLLAWWRSMLRTRSCSANGWRGGVPSESFALILSVPAAAAQRRRFPPWRRWPWSSIRTHVAGLGSPGEIPSSGFPGGRRRRLRRDLPGGVVLEALSSFGVCSSRRRVGGCRGSGPERLMFVRRGGGLGNQGGQRLHGVGQLLHMAWVTILCRLCDEVVSSVDAPQWRWLTFTSGRRPRMLVRRAVVCERFAPCSLGCGWPCRAASWLECERWYVGMAVPEGGVGGPLGVVEQLSWMSGRRPRSFGSVGC